MLGWMYGQLAKAKKARGFSLIELMVVVAIIGILFVVLVPKLTASKDKAKLAGAKTDIRAIEMAIVSYMDDKSAKTFPAASAGKIDRTEINSKYLDSNIEKDPWNLDYNYAVSSDSKFVVVWTSGGTAAETLTVDTSGVVTNASTDKKAGYVVLGVDANGNVKRIKAEGL